MSEGAGLSISGVSLTPVDAHGSTLGGSEGVMDGASVLYANTQTDTDMVLKPTPRGFSADALLRSVDSPEKLFFKVGLPEGASLEEAKDGSGAVNVVFAGRAIATVLAPSAHDSAGTPVPVSMSASGDILAVTVDQLSGSYQYPIAVDPEVIDTALDYPGNWTFGTDTHRHFMPRTSVSRLTKLSVVASTSSPKRRLGSILLRTKQASSCFWSIRRRRIAYLQFRREGTRWPEIGPSMRGGLRIENASNQVEAGEVALPFPKGELETTLAIKLRA